MFVLDWHVLLLQGLLGRGWTSSVLWFWLALRACQRFRRQVREVENGLIRELSRALRESSTGHNDWRRTDEALFPVMKFVQQISSQHSMPIGQEALHYSKSWGKKTLTFIFVFGKYNCDLIQLHSNLLYFIVQLSKGDHISCSMSSLLFEVTSRTMFFWTRDSWSQLDKHIFDVVLQNSLDSFLRSRKEKERVWLRLIGQHKAPNSFGIECDTFFINPFKRQT